MRNNDSNTVVTSSGALQTTNRLVRGGVSPPNALLNKWSWEIATGVFDFCQASVDHLQVRQSHLHDITQSVTFALSALYFRAFYSTL